MSCHRKVFQVPTLDEIDKAVNGEKTGEDQPWGLRDEERAAGQSVAWSQGRAWDRADWGRGAEPGVRDGTLRV